MFSAKTAFFATLLFLSSGLFAVEPVQTSFLSSTAASGYDVVSYFTEGAPFKGKKEFVYEWKGAKWRFASEENLSLFKANPDYYAPQFGGYCAYAVGLGSTAPGDPQQFSIVDDKLYLNYSSKTKVLWEDDRDQFIQAGAENWIDLLAK